MILLNECLKALAIFLGAGLLDAVWAKYIQAAAKGNKLWAANWSLGIYMLGSVITLTYVADHWMIIPAALGSWVGTYLGTKAPVAE